MKIRSVSSASASGTGILLFVIAGSLTSGCTGSRHAVADDESFFEPVKTIERPSPAHSSSAGIGESRPASHARADSLMAVQKIQEQRVQALSDQLQLLGAARRSGASDSFNAMHHPPSPAPKPAVRTSTVSYADVLRFYRSGDYPKALNGFQEILKRGVPKNPEDEYYLPIGVCQYHLNQIAEAIATLRRVVNAPDAKRKGDAYYVLGLAQTRLGNFREAKNMFEAVLKQNPGKDFEASTRKKLEALPPAK